MEAKKLTIESASKIGQIASECFVDDEYFDYLSINKTEKKNKLYQMYKETALMTFKYGEILGAVENNEIIGFLMVLNYCKLKDNSKDYEDIFNTEGNEYSNDVLTFIKYANMLENPEYMLAICVKPEHQKKGVGTFLVNYALKTFKGKQLISDVDNPNSLSIYKKLGFDIKKISDKFYFIELQNEKVDDKII